MSDSSSKLSAFTVACCSESVFSALRVICSSGSTILQFSMSCNTIVFDSQITCTNTRLCLLIGTNNLQKLVGTDWITIEPNRDFFNI